MKDTGIGIPKQEQASIFDKFYQVGSTTKGVREGTGLGLAITKQLVEMHGGGISGGKRARQGQHVQLHDSRGEAQEETADKPLILIVEDEPAAQELLVTYLEPRGFRTEVAPRCKGPLRSRGRPGPSAVTLDLGLPGYSGWRALEEFHDRAEFRAVPIIVVSVRDNDGSAQTRGASAFLQKPLKRDVLLHTLREHLK